MCFDLSFLCIINSFITSYLPFPPFFSFFPLLLFRSFFLGSRLTVSLSFIGTSTPLFLILILQLQSSFQSFIHLSIKDLWKRYTTPALINAHLLFLQLFLIFFSSVFSTFAGRISPVGKISSFSASSSPIPQYSKHFPLKTAKRTRPKLSLQTLPRVNMGSPPALGALGAMFTAMRLLQAVCLITIIGLSGNFVAELVSTSVSTPSALIGTLVVVGFLSF